MKMLTYQEINDKGKKVKICQRYSKDKTQENIDPFHHFLNTESEKLTGYLWHIEGER